MFIDSTHKYLAKDLEDQERILAHLIKVEGSRDCLPSVRSKRIKSALESETSLHIQDKRAKCAKEGMELLTFPNLVTLSNSLHFLSEFLQDCISMLVRYYYCSARLIPYRVIIYD